MSNENGVDALRARRLSRFDFTADPDREVIEIGELGEGVKLTKSEKIELGVGTAQELLDMPQFIGERKLRENHVRTLLDAMQGGTFRWEFVKLIVCRCRDQHRGLDSRG